MFTALLSKPVFKHLKKKLDYEKVDEVLELTHLKDIKDKPITNLSGGQLQRVFLAKTLAQEPNIILLDEPTNHIDIIGKESLESMRLIAFHLL